MTEFTGLQPQVELTPKPERLSDAELSNLVSAIGNSEAKAVLLCMIQPGTIYTQKDLGRLFNSSQGQRPAWTQSSKDIEQYCEQSFQGVGLVAKKITDETDQTYGWLKTEYGDDKGTALAGLLLDFSLKHPEFSLYQFFGVTSSAGKATEIPTEVGNVAYKNRAAGLRMQVFMELLTENAPVRVQDIVANTGLDDAVLQKNLDQLARFGIIEFEGAGRVEGKSITYYKLNNTPVESLPALEGRDSLSQRVMSALQGDPDKVWTIDGVIEKMLDDEGITDETERGKRKVTMKGRISQTLALFRERNILSHEGFSSNEKSRVSLNEDQRAVVYDLMSTLMSFQDQDPETLSRGRDTANNLTTDQIVKLTAKARDNSPYAQRRFSQDREAEVLSLIQNNPGITTKEIQEALEKQGHNRSYAGLMTMLSGVRGKSVTGEASKSGQYIKWFVNEPNSEIQKVK